LPLPGTDCGSSACGFNACGDEPGTVVCLDIPANACGGCVPSALVPDDPCSICGVPGVVACETAPGGESVPLCNAPDVQTNACGGCAALSASPGSQCGECGFWSCVTGDESVECIDPCGL
jgi:hypothetical protein